MLSIGQKVLYGSNGVCTLDDITLKKIGKTEFEYYVLKPVHSGTQTLFVPTGNSALVEKIRSIISREEAEAILNDLPDPGDWNVDKTERGEQFREIVNSGDRRNIVALFRLITKRERYLKSQGRSLQMADERIYREIKRILSEEFSEVLGIEKDQALAMLLK